jgi:hypothetical protein
MTWASSSSVRNVIHPLGRCVRLLHPGALQRWHSSLAAGFTANAGVLRFIVFPFDLVNIPVRHTRHTRQSIFDVDIFLRVYARARVFCVLKGDI